jgi:hypothetical protein
MMTTPTLNSPTYRVVVGDWSDEATWQAHEVRALGRDLQMAEQLFSRHKQWGKPMDSPIKFQAVAAFYALKRAGGYSGSWDTFESEYLEVTEAGNDEVGPTNPAADDD